MVILLCLVAGVLVIPLMIDIQKHGPDNILKRSGEDILALPPVAALFEFVGSSVRVVGSAIAITTTLSLVVVFLVVVWRVLLLVSYVFQALLGR